MQQDITKRLIWSGMLAAFGALATILTTRMAAMAYRKLFDEDPPE
jgi:hypothetical protein